MNQVTHSSCDDAGDGTLTEQSLAYVPPAEFVYPSERDVESWLRESEDFFRNLEICDGGLPEEDPDNPFYTSDDFEKDLRGARRIARKAGLLVISCRRGWSRDNFGLYKLLNVGTRTLFAGARFQLELHQIIELANAKLAWEASHRSRAGLGGNEQLAAVAPGEAHE